MLRTPGFWLLGLIVVALPMGSNAEDLPADKGQIVLHLLDYISVEYPEFVQNGKVTNAEEYAEQVEFSGQVAESVRSFPAHPEKAPLVAAATTIAKLVNDKAEGTKVVTAARDLQGGLIKAYKIQIAPPRAPDMRDAAALYQANCAACHGTRGAGDGAQAGGLEPAPSNFREQSRQFERSVYGLYNTISLGVEGTSMVAFSSLRPEERWALAFYVSQFASSDEDRGKGARAWNDPGLRARFPGLAEVVGTTPAEALKSGDAAYAVLAHLRAHPEALRADSGASPLDVASQKILESAGLYKQGQFEAAHQAAISAYLEGFELAEATLDQADHSLRNRIELDMMAYRNLLKSGGANEAVEKQSAALVQAFEKAAAATGSGELSAAGAFTSAFIIIVREGLEAILVLAAIAAFLIKSGRREGMVHLHAGWIGALLLGILTWIVSSTLIEISGAQREVTEGLTALLSAGVLLYAGYWLHSRSYASRWQSFIRGQVSDALSRRTLYGIALISFLAVYREVFETVLFMQALWVQAGPAARSSLLGGAGVSFAVLAVLAWIISRYSARLPLGLFFNLSSIFLAILAVVFAGKGVAALQAAGKLPADPVAISGIPSLGIYPNSQGLALQAVLVTVIVASIFYSRASAARR